jgi:hypothetical protein
VQVSAVRRPLRLGDCPSFYRPRRRQFTSVPHCFIYVWGYGVQCRAVDGRPSESCIWRGVMACPVSVQEWLRGWRCRGRPFGHCLYMGSRMRLTGGRVAHNSRRGGVLSPRPPQCWGWRCSARDGVGDDGDGRTGPMATEVTSPAGPTSWRCPVRAWRSRLSSLRGLHRPPSRVRRVGRTRVGGTVPRDCCRPCRTSSHSGGDGLTGGVGGTVSGRDSQARRGVDSSLTRAPAYVNALNATARGAGMEAVGP